MYALIKNKGFLQAGCVNVYYILITVICQGVKNE